MEDHCFRCILKLIDTTFILAWPLSPFALKCEVKVLVPRSCLILRTCNLPGFSVRGILQASVLEWVAIPFFRASSDPEVEPGSRPLQVDSLPSEPSLTDNTGSKAIHRKVVSMVLN